MRLLYLAAEGAGGLGNRIKAFCKKHDIEPSSCGLSVMRAAPNILVNEDIKELLWSIRAAGGFDVIFVDTFAQVTPGANENGADDMGRALANLRTLAEASGAMPILVHHAGKDASRGARGWSGLKAAADVQIEIVRRDNNMREIHLEKMKDGEDGARFGFELEVIDLGVDEDGGIINSCVVNHLGKLRMENPRRQAGPKGDNQRRVLDCAQAVGAGSPSGAPLKDVIDRAVSSVPFDPASRDDGPKKRDQRRAHVTRALNALCDRGVLVTRGERIYLAGMAPEGLD